MTSKDIVAIILASSVLLFILLGVGRSYFSGLVPVKVEILDAWSTVIQVIVGGLLGFISRDK